MEIKPFYLSKTFWVNIIALVAMLIQTKTGFVIDLETQTAILAIINLILRALTGSEISFGGKTFRR